jgi:hypothetical protein
MVGKEWTHRSLAPPTTGFLQLVLERKKALFVFLHLIYTLLCYFEISPGELEFVYFCFGHESKGADEMG